MRVGVKGPGHLARVAGVSSFDPLSLNPLLLHDAERADLLSLSGGLVNSITGADVNGRVFSQTVSGCKPLYDATGFNGRPCITSDGVDDELTLASDPGGTLPAGAAPCEIWWCGSQLLSGADPTTGVLFQWGGNSAGSSRYLRRTVASGVNRAQSAQGVTHTAPGDFTGPHVLTGVLTADASANSWAAMDKNASTPATATTTTVFARARKFANSSSTASGWSRVSENFLGVFPILSADQRAALWSYLGVRAGLVL